MKSRLLTGLAALSLLGTVATMAAPAAMAQGPDYRTWQDARDIRQDMRAVRGEDRRIASDRNALRHDYYSGNRFAAERDRQALHQDMRARAHDRTDASIDRHDLHHDWNH